MRAQIIALVMQEYAKKRARAEAAALRAKIVKSAPMYADLGAALAGAMAACAKRGEDADEKLRALRARAEGQLREAGYAPKDLAPRYDCALCRDTGYVGDAPKRFCSCFEKRLKEEIVLRSGLGSAPGHTFDAFDLSVFSDEAHEGGLSQRANMARMRNFAMDWADAFPGNARKDIVLSGQTGLGKTFLLDCIAARVIGRGYTVLRMTAFRLLEAMRLRHMGRDEDDLLGVLLTAELLLIDDLGTEPLLENISLEYLFTVLNERQQSGLSTLVATNLSPAELRARYSERITSRLLNQERCALFLVKGQDVRIRAAKTRQEGTA